MVSSGEQAFLDETRAWVRSGGDIDARFDNISMRLHDAAKLGYCSALRWLLDHGADVEATKRYGTWTPLQFAAGYGRCEAAVVLLDAGANINARDCRADTALHCAACDGHLFDARMCKLLVSRGASLDARSDSGRDPEALARLFNRSNNAAFLADVRAAGSWSAYVAAPRNQLLGLRRELPTRFRAGPCRARAQARLFLDPRIPDDVFMYVLQFWRCARDSEY